MIYFDKLIFFAKSRKFIKFATPFLISLFRQCSTNNGDKKYTSSGILIFATRCWTSDASSEFSLAPYRYWFLIKLPKSPPALPVKMPIKLLAKNAIVLSQPGFIFCIPKFSEVYQHFSNGQSMAGTYFIKDG